MRHRFQIESRLLLPWLLVVGCSTAAPIEPRDASAFCTSGRDCDDGLFCNGDESCAPADPGADSRGCVAPSERGCPASMGCSEADDACIVDCSDDDGDGDASDACGGMDCDDSDAARFWGNVEVCDASGHDEDCDPSTVGVADRDADGHTDAHCCNGDVCGRDCDDSRAGVRPGVPEVCNRYDDDCNGAVDEGGVAVSLRVDRDRDGDGDRDAESMNVCAGSAGFATISSDCEDAPGPTARLRSGRITDVTDGIDNDCDGMVDESSPAAILFEDRDHDGYGTRRETRASTRPIPGFALLEGDCDDLDPFVSPGAPVELCNGIDDDCDTFGFELARNDFEDDDMDGIADASCEGGRDCDDRDPSVGPGQLERCNLRDDDCDGTVDESCDPVDGGVAVADGGDVDAGADPGVDAGGSDGGTCSPAPLFRDADGDGAGDAADFIVGCPPVTGYVDAPGDCDDADPGRSPSLSDTPGVVGVDDDCDGTVDA